MIAINLTSGRPVTPTHDPVGDGWRQLVRALLVRAARDAAKGYVPDGPDEGSAHDFLAMPEARELATLVGLLPGEGER